MAKNLAKKLIENHLVSGSMKIGQEIGIRIDHTLTQDATGTMVMLELEAMNLNRAKTDLSVQYIDHNQVQEDHKNPDDHVFLQSAAKRYGLWLSKAGNGISHQVHCERFAVPGKTLLGSDSHTPANGCLAMLAIGAGGLEVALSMCEEPFFFKMPKIVGVKLIHELPHWVSAKDVILEMLRRFDVFGGVGKIFEYYGPGLQHLSLMDRHVIANMGAELGATTSVFPSDMITKQFLRQMGREGDWMEISADSEAEYDEYIEIDLSQLEPLIALPSSPGNVRKVRDVAGLPIYQSYIGSSANPGLRDFVIPALMVKDKRVADSVSFDVNPPSRQVLYFLTENGFHGLLTKAGARIHQAGCNGCIGMGQAPATNQISLRTVPRNFPGRSGTKEDKVYLCSPETAVASALMGCITDPRDLGQSPHIFIEPQFVEKVCDLIPPPPENSCTKGELIKGPNISGFATFDALPDLLKLPVILKLGDNISTDDISPAGVTVLPYRSNIEKLSEFTYYKLDEDFYRRAMDSRKTGSVIVAGENYGQGSSREHAAIAPRYLGVRLVLAKSVARIHRKNLINFGIIPLSFCREEDYDDIDVWDEIEVADIHDQLRCETIVKICNITKSHVYEMNKDFSARELEAIYEGGLMEVIKKRNKKEAS